MKKCCKDFHNSIYEIYKDRTFDWQCPECDEKHFQRRSVDGGLDYYGRSPEGAMSYKILTSAVDGKYGEKPKNAVIESMKKAAKMGKAIKIKVWDRYKRLNHNALLLGVIMTIFHELRGGDE